MRILEKVLDQMVRVDQGVVQLTDDPIMDYTQKQKDQLNSLKLDIFKLNHQLIESLLGAHSVEELEQLSEESFENLWLLTQHVDHDIAFQKKVLSILRDEALAHKVSKKNIAFLTDRILINEGKPQVYGTQVTYDTQGKAIPREIKNRDQLDSLRASMQLQPIQDYLNFMNLLRNPQDSNQSINFHFE